MANIDKIIKSKYQPKQTNVAWVDLSGETPVEKHFINGRWVEISGGSIDISGKADKVNTPQIIVPSVDGSIIHLTAEEIESLRLGDIVTDNTVAPRIRTWIVFEKQEINPEQVSLAHVMRTSILVMNWTKSNSSWSCVASGLDFETFASKIGITNSQPVGGMTSNTLYNLGEITENTTFVMGGAQDNTIANVWMWTFSTGSTAPTITWPAQITMWSDGDAPDIEANKYYEVSVMNGVGTVISADIPQKEETEVEP